MDKNRLNGMSCAQGEGVNRVKTSKWPSEMQKSSVKTSGKNLARKRRSTASAFTFVEVIVSAAILALALGMVMTAAVKGLEVAKWQSAYETACSYAEQGLEYALFVPYSDFSNTAPSQSAPNWVSNGMLYTTVTTTNLIATTQMGTPVTLTNVTYLATQTSLPLDDLGSYVLNRDVVVTDRTALEPGSANLNYKLITVSNTWVFCGRTNPPIVYRVIRDMP